MVLPDPFDSSPAPAPRSKGRLWLLPLAVGVAIALFVLSKRLTGAGPEPAAPALAPPVEFPAETVHMPEEPAPAPAVRYAIEVAELQPRPALPALDDSDGPLVAALTRLVDQAACARFLVLTDCIRHVVATVDNLTSSVAPVRLWPVQPVGGRYLATGTGDALRPAPENSRRYEPVLAFMESMDAAKVVALYVDYYPLFQEAYRELGYPDGDFNTRLVQVMDHLLATPDVMNPALVPHALMFKYANPELEALSAGQKQLIRMGSANAQRVKAKLRELRQELTRNRHQG